ncbi:heterokaryon incompatibility protein-domain-containing protein [Alternaria alternata]|nr:heterokaryon incompatibility protein-domain-containing protein [Alternaria alternata]
MTHTRCAQRRGERTHQTPTRLLQVQPFKPSPKAYLRQTAQIPKDARYTTLSHCWGQYMPIKLEINTLQEFLDGIHIDRFPPTFQQAIMLTESLGIEYIWIDSLCIIQDDKNDWANECSRMTSVYMNSFINIGANAARDSRGGLFQQRSWKSVNPLFVPLTYVPTNWHREPVVLWPNSPSGNLLDHAPLGDRGWIVQERLLASRTVHFLKHEVAPETDVTGKLEDFNFFKRTYVAIPTAPFPGAIDRITPFLDTWANIVNLYSTGKLSVATDKLVALSGVAKYMFEHRQDNRALRHYAGHWSQDFELQLRWSASPFSTGSRSQTYVAPSWSWASYNGKVLLPRPHCETSVVQLISIETFPQSDPFGAVSASFRGYVRF